MMQKFYEVYKKKMEEACYPVCHFCGAKLNPYWSYYSSKYSGRKKIQKCKKCGKFVEKDMW